MSRQHTGSLPDTFARALAALRGDTPPAPIAIAYSGGLDSSALLHLAHAYAREHGVALHAFHVHHGISPNADAWLAHCAANCGALEAYVAAHAIAHIDDESNTDPRYARNALRQRVMPALAASFPGFQERFARSAAHAQSAQRLLTELAQQDLALCLDGACLDVAKLRAMSMDRVYNLLRYWFATRSLRMPSTAWLTEMAAQLVEARHDAQLLVTHPDCHIRRHRDRLYITPKLGELAGLRDPDDDGVIERDGEFFTWRGEAQLAFPAYGGILHFDEAEQGIDAAWLRAQQLQIDFRKGGERLKPAPNRPTRSLKYHYQACDVPAWERKRLPIVSAGRALLFAAGIGMDCHHVSEGPEPRIRLRWQAQAS